MGLFSRTGRSQNVYDSISSLCIRLSSRRIEEQYHEHVQAKTEATIESAHQKDEQLDARLQAKMSLEHESLNGDASPRSFT